MNRILSVFSLRPVECMHRPLDTTGLEEASACSAESHSLNGYMLNIYRVPGTMLGDRQRPCPHGAVQGDGVHTMNESNRPLQTVTHTMKSVSKDAVMAVKGVFGRQGSGATLAGVIKETSLRK